MQARESQSPRLYVAGVVSFYIVAALVMVFVNNAVLNKTPDLPFTFLFIQSAIAILLLRLLEVLSRTSLRSILPEFKTPRVNRRTNLITILPYLSVGCTGLIFNTLLLGECGYSILPGKISRGLALPFTIVVSSVESRARPEPQVVVPAFIVTCGFLIRSAPAFYRKSSSNLSRDSAIALFYGCMSSFALLRVGDSVLTLSYFGNLFSSTAMLVCVLFHGELALLRQRIENFNEDWATFIAGSLITGVFGFLLGMAGSLSIKAAKGVVQILLGIAIFGDVVTTWVDSFSSPKAIVEFEPFQVIACLQH
ncbi:hypothetical protein DFH09DRAFT_1324791 [Mycena vulgaris]|nr:hypothetical protein DFH09DRAFT_1324791 [Mycena vulgaris]